MQRKWYGGDTELSVRMAITMFLLAAVYLGFLAILWSAGVDAVSLLIVAGVIVLVQLLMSERLVLWSMGARVVSPDDAPQLHASVERLAALADLPKPKVAISNSNMPNAFAIGLSPKGAVVTVTTGLLNSLTQPEIDAVIAHELSLVRNRDVMVITIASFLSTVAFMFVRMSFFFGGGGLGRRRDREGSAIVLAYLAALVVWAISFFLIRALSRYREYAADRGSAVLTGSPSQLSSALLKISGRMQRIPERDLREVEGFSAFFIIPAATKSSLMELFSTHPSLEKRLARLSQMEQQMERG